MKTLVKILPVAAAMIMSACNSEMKIDEPNNTANDGRQIISLRIEGNVGNLSRAGRVLESSQPGDQVDNVKVILTDSKNNVVWTKLLENWSSDDLSSSWVNEGTTYRETQIEILKEDYRMTNGETYNLYAIGYCNNSDYDLADIVGLEVGATFDNANTVVTIKDGVVGEEIFAGYNTVVGNENGVNQPLSLTRQVAGVYTYITKIPLVRTSAGYIGRYMHLVASNKQSTLALGHYADEMACDIDGESTIIYTIDLKDWYSDLVEGKDEDGIATGCIATGDNWIGNAEKFENGAVFGSSFIIPFVKNDAVSLVLTMSSDAENSNVLRTWNILLPNTSFQLQDYNVSIFNGKEWSVSKVADTAKSYSVLRNYLYAIGVHPNDRLDDAVEGQTYEDEPLPINNKQNLNVEVNHNWDSIVVMGVE